MIVIAWIVGILLYAAMGFVAAGLHEKRWGNRKDCVGDFEGCQLAVGLVWPIGLPAVLGTILYEKIAGKSIYDK